MNDAEIPHVPIGKEEIKGNEEQDWDCNQPFHPWKLDIEVRALRKVDAKEHEAKRHSGLGRNVPEESKRQNERVRNEGDVDKKRVEVAEDAQDEPSMRITRASEDNPKSNE